MGWNTEAEKNLEARLIRLEKLYRGTLKNPFQKDFEGYFENTSCFYVQGSAFSELEESRELVFID